jgi:hypothetical protein
VVHGLSPIHRATALKDEAVGISQVDAPLENTVLGQDGGLAIFTEKGRDTLLAKVKDRGIQLLLPVETVHGTVWDVSAGLHWFS